MSHTRTFPARRAPSPTNRPILAREKVTVRSAHTASPGTRPVSASTPEGRSAATTFASERLMSRAAEAAGSRRAERSPTPNRASTMTSAPRAKAVCPPSPGSKSSRVPPMASSRRAISRWSSVSLSRLPVRNTRTCQPSRRRMPAAAVPSPPLLPGPTKTAARFTPPGTFRRKGKTPWPVITSPLASGRYRLFSLPVSSPSSASSRTASATPSAARSMRVSEGMPRSRMARWSIRFICSAVASSISRRSLPVSCPYYSFCRRESKQGQGKMWGPLPPRQTDRSGRRSGRSCLSQRRGPWCGASPISSGRCGW